MLHRFSEQPDLSTCLDFLAGLALIGSRNMNDEVILRDRVFGKQQMTILVSPDAKQHIDKTFYRKNNKQRTQEDI